MGRKIQEVPSTIHDLCLTFKKIIAQAIAHQKNTSYAIKAEKKFHVSEKLPNLLPPLKNGPSLIVYYSPTDHVLSSKGETILKFSYQNVILYGVY